MSYLAHVSGLSVATCSMLFRFLQIRWPLSGSIKGGCLVLQMSSHLRGTLICYFTFSSDFSHFCIGGWWLHRPSSSCLSTSLDSTICPRLSFSPNAVVFVFSTAMIIWSWDYIGICYSLHWVCNEFWLIDSIGDWISTMRLDSSDSLRWPSHWMLIDSYLILILYSLYFDPDSNGITRLRITQGFVWLLRGRQGVSTQVLSPQMCVSTAEI